MDVDALRQYHAVRRAQLRNARTVRYSFVVELVRHAPRDTHDTKGLQRRTKTLDPSQRTPEEVRTIAFISPALAQPYQQQP